MARRAGRRPARGAAGGAGAPNLNPGGTVLAFQNRTLAVFRGQKPNRFGDLSDVGEPLYGGIPAALAEVAENAFDAATQRLQTIRTITCVVPHWADILVKDTVMDEFTRYFYMVESLQEQPGIGYYPPQKILTLRMRSGVSVKSD